MIRRFTSRVRTASIADGGNVAAGASLFAITVIAWMMVWRDASQMVMPTEQLSLSDGARFTLQWGVMMTAMMLPSAMPMLLLYRTVSRRLGASGDRVAPVWLFVLVYLTAWLLPGIPLYLTHVALNVAALRIAALNAAIPYLVALTLAAAGAYQFSGIKRACLRECESPMSFLMARWKAGYGNTLRLALSHSAYCIGCCWGLMAILVVAGAMSLPWVLAISTALFAEKVLPGGWRTSRIIGALLLCTALVVALRPELAARMSGRMDGSMKGMNMEGMDMPGMDMPGMNKR